MALAANGRDQCPQASKGCVISCVQRLSVITVKEKIVLDDGNHIFDEYQHYLAWDPRDQQRVGYAFFKWVHDNQYNPDKCDRIHISPRSGDGGNYLEFPDDPDLQTFPRDDRKFVAVALAHPTRPPILNAVDTDWWIFRKALERNGVCLEFLCPDDLQAMANRYSCE